MSVLCYPFQSGNYKIFLHIISNFKNKVRMIINIIFFFAVKSYKICTSCYRLYSIYGYNYITFVLCIILNAIFFLKDMDIHKTRLIIKKIIINIFQPFLKTFKDIFKSMFTGFRGVKRQENASKRANYKEK